MAGNGNGAPRGGRTAKLGDLIPPEAMEELVPVMNRIRGGKLDQMKGQKRLLEILERHREALLEKGVLPEYLSYLLLSLSMGGAGGDLGSVTI